MREIDARTFCKVFFSFIFLFFFIRVLQSIDTLKLPTRHVVASLILKNIPFLYFPVYLVQFLQNEPNICNIPFSDVEFVTEKAFPCMLVYIRTLYNYLLAWLYEMSAFNSELLQSLGALGLCC